MKKNSSFDAPFSRIKTLIANLRDNNSEVAISAIHSLKELGNSQAIEGLIVGLHHENVLVSHAASESLVNIGAPTVPLLIDTLTDPDETVRFLAAISLARIGDIRAILPLINALGDSDRITRVAISSIFSLFGNSVINLLITASKDENRNIREGAVNALGSFKDAKVIDALLETLEDNDGEVYISTINSLARVGDERAIPVLRHISNIHANEYIKELAFYAVDEIKKRL